MYCSTDDVYRISGITSTEISVANVTEFIKDAEMEVDKWCFTTFWAVEDSGTATAGANTTLTDSGKAWTIDAFTGDYVWIYGGTGINQIKEIASNTATILTITEAWDTNPSTDSTYRIIHTGGINPVVDKTFREEKPSNDLYYTDKYPVRKLNSVAVDSVTVTPSTITITSAGGLVFTSDSEVSFWATDREPKNVINYWLGVYPIPREIKTLTALKAAIYVLEAQMGGTHNIPSSYSLPEGQVTIGQAYVNIEGTRKAVQKRHDALAQSVKRYPRII